MLYPELCHFQFWNYSKYMWYAYCSSIVTFHRHISSNIDTRYVSKSECKQKRKVYMRALLSSSKKGTTKLATRQQPLLLALMHLLFDIAILKQEPNLQLCSTHVNMYIDNNCKHKYDNIGWKIYYACWTEQFLPMVPFYFYFSSPPIMPCAVLAVVMCWLPCQLPTFTANRHSPMCSRQY